MEAMKMADRALLIEWHSDGKRAGNINPRDKKLQCYGWQNMDVTPMLELRVVEDDRDLSELEDVKGVIIIEGKENINQAIDDNFPVKYYLSDEFLYQEHFKQKNGNLFSGININKLPDDLQERLGVLRETHGLKGIAKKERKHV